ncbi:MAG: hypothetical protein IPL60_09540 [Ardenticatenia bacterium]|nr:hypothetical protein [Ardenticatenia bacterium]
MKVLPITRLDHYVSDTLPAIWSWRENLATECETAIVWMGFQMEMSLGEVSFDMMIEALQKLSSHKYAAEREAQPRLSILVLRSFAEDEPRYRLLRDRVAGDDWTGHAVTYTTTTFMHTTLTRSGGGGEYRTIGPGQSELTKQHRIIRRILRGEIEKRELAKRKIPIGGKDSNRLIWFSQYEEIQSAVTALAGSSATNEQRATIICSALGMAHVHGGTLIEIVVEHDRLPDLRAPCIFSGRGNPHFWPARRQDRWGNAIDVSTLGSGLPEAIHPNTITWNDIVGRPTPIADLSATPISLSEHQWDVLFECAKRAVEDYT